MKRVLTAVLAAAVAGALFVAGPLGAAPKGTEHFNKNTERDSGQDCGEGNTLAINAPTKLWPPNHKYFDGLYVVARDADGGAIELTTTGTHDQYDADTGTEMNGSGNTADDIAVTDDEAEVTTSEDDPQPAAIETGNDEVKTDWAARAERSGRDQTGRTYTLSGTAVFDEGTATCSWSWNFEVPHDMRPANRQNDVEQG